MAKVYAIFCLSWWRLLLEEFDQMKYIDIDQPAIETEHHCIDQLLKSFNRLLNSFSGIMHLNLHCLFISWPIKAGGLGTKHFKWKLFIDTLSGLQSKELIGCVDMVAFWSRETEPATPNSIPLESFSTLLSGYELKDTHEYQKQSLNVKLQ